MLSPISSASTLSARFQLNRNLSDLFETTKRLSTGKRINSGKDDPAGLISSEQLKAEIKALEAQTRSLRRADSNVRISEGHASQLSSLFGDLDALVIASANTAGMSDEEIAANQMQIDSTVESIRRFGGDAVNSLGGFNMPHGGNEAAASAINGAIATALSVQSGGANDLASGNFEAASTALRAAMTSVATVRGQLGSFQKNNIGPQVRSNQITIENLTASRSRIVDADFAVETSKLNRLTVLVAAGFKTLKIAQLQGNSILDLLA